LALLAGSVDWFNTGIHQAIAAHPNTSQDVLDRLTRIRDLDEGILDFEVRALT
jgi:hypothetical protein